MPITKQLIEGAKWVDDHLGEYSPFSQEQELRAGDSVFDLADAGELASQAILRRALLLELYFTRHRKIEDAATSALYRAKDLDERKNAEDTFLVAHGLRVAGREGESLGAPAKRHERYFICMLYTQRLLETANSELYRYWSGELTQDDFPDQPLWEAARAVATTLGREINDESALRKLITRARPEAPFPIPTPRGFSL